MWDDRGNSDDDSCESDPGEEEGTDAPYYDTVADDESTLDSRVDINKHLYGDEDAYLKYFEGAPEFEPGEVDDLLKDDCFGGDSDSSFNDDNVPESERELFSSSWDEDEADDYVPPITNRKKVLLHQLMRYVVNEDDSEKDMYRKENEREAVIEEFKTFLLKRRVILAFKRLQKLKDADLKTPEQGGFFLEKLELVDKKLDRPFYYEPMEPEPYKRLLQKRKKAIKRKYELYAVDSAYRREVHDRTMACLQNVIDPAAINKERVDRLLDATQNLEDLSDGLSDTEDEEGEEEQSDRYELSSFYDTKIPESEKDYFSSPFEEDAVPHPGPKSRRLFKYNRLLNRCKPRRTDIYAERQRKYLKRVEIMAEFKNFLERKRAVKALAKFKMVEQMNLDIAEEAEELLNFEILDKKLHKAYYYTKDEPRTYKRLLIKRRNAIIKKYERYAKDADYRELLKNKAYVDYVRSKPAERFEDVDKSEDASEESSLNDTEIPTSDEEFMSAPDVKCPLVFKKPITRNKEALYKILEKYEADKFDSEAVISKKQKARLKAIQNYRDQLLDRRKIKALGRLEKMNRMAIDDPGIRANKLEEMELRDKKLDREYYYMPDEPKPITELLKKRRRAIHRKYEKYVRDKDFRKKMENRIKKELYELSKKNIEKLPKSEAANKVGFMSDHEHFVHDRPERRRRSMLPTERKILRRRDCAVGGIWPKHRDSAPAKMDRPMKVDEYGEPHYDHLSLGYGVDKYEGGNRLYQKQYLKWCEEEEDWESDGEWEDEDDGCEPDSEAGKGNLADAPYYDTVADDDSTLGSRVDIDKHLYGDEDVFLKYFEGAPEFVHGEAVDMVIDADGRDDGESSFNDDNVPESEREFFSSSWDEDEAGEYVPPITTRKKVLIYGLMRNVVNENDSQHDIYYKEHDREMVLQEFKNFLLKRRAILAFKRLQKLKDADLKTTEQGAFFLEKLEIIDKKLDRPFYYEPMEPEPYKRLLQKRKKAIRRKYELYAVDSDYRREIHDRTMACLQNVIDPADLSQERADMLVDAAQSLEDPWGELSDKEVDEQGQEVLSEIDKLSSFYDTKIPESELEYFSSPFEEDEVPHPGPKSRRLFKYNRLLNRCKPRRTDKYVERQRKYLKKIEIMAEFKNFLERSRAIKCLAKFKTLDIYNVDTIGKEAKLLLDMEIMDKKLHKDYYYTQDESDTYKYLLLKRRNAIIKKYERYVKEPEYREVLRNKAHVDFLGIKEAPLFEELGASTGSSEESSLNDTEIPTSDEDFMSAPDVKLPQVFKKPITRNKEALYKILEKYEADKFDSQDVISEKQKARLAAIQNYREQLIDRRKVKAIGRLDRVNRMGVNDPGIRANKLEELELRDKKLNRKYYYMPKEPKPYTELLKKRRRAIHRKYEKYVSDKNFREKMENRLKKQVYQLPKKKIEKLAESEEAHRDEERLVLDRPEMRRRSMLPTEKKVLRRAECAVAGIWPKHRESAPPKMERSLKIDEDGVPYIDHLSMGYGLEKFEDGNKFYHEHYLKWWCEEEEDWDCDGEWEDEDDGCEPDSEAGKGNLADAPYYDTVADDDSTLGSRVDIDKHLYGDEDVFLKYFEAAPEFVHGEAVDMVIDADGNFSSSIMEQEAFCLLKLCHLNFPDDLFHKDAVIIYGISCLF